MSPNTTPPRLHRPPPARGEIVDYVVSEREAAEIIGVSPDTLRRMVKRGEGPDRIKISVRRIGYRLSALNDFLTRVTETVRDHEAQSQKVSPGKGGGELAPDGEAPFVSQKRRRPLARGEPHVAQLGEAGPHVARRAERGHPNVL
jgi:predicted DNA-binding transcriptional regulator AlpA